MKLLFRYTLATGLLIATAGSAYATHDTPAKTPQNKPAEATPAGTWKQVDDVTGQATSLIQITRKQGKFEAKVLKMLYMTPEQFTRDGMPPHCTQCKGERHNQPITGMTIMWGVHKGNKNNVWDGGHILDPNNGKTYKVKLSLKDHGSKLAVRGYIFIPLFGRTQVWTRQ